MTHLLADFTFFDRGNESTCLISLLSFEKLLQDTDIPLNHGKRCLPSTCQTVYGIEIDMAVMELRLPDDKLTKAIVSELYHKLSQGHFEKFTFTHWSAWSYHQVGHFSLV